VITDARLAGFTFSLSGSTLTYTGGSLTLGNIPAGSLVARAAAEGGVQLTLALHPHNDFNGDGRSDILWRNDSSGQIVDWLATPNGGFNGNAAHSLNPIGADFQVAGTGDFNGDGRVDILWRSTSTGTIVDWLGTSNGGFAGNGANSNNSVSTSIHLVGVGDFNGDGRSDILWMTDAGRVVDWLGTATGGFAGNAAHSSNFVAAGWTVAGIGDFNGDGISDILFQNGNRIIDWLGSPTGNGGFIGNAANSSGLLSVGWSVAGTGDFDGDGHDDLLLINSSTGQISDWLGTASGGFADNAANALTSLPTGFQVAQIGDFNGDGIDDVLMRNPTTGQITDWLGNPNGSGAFIDNTAHAAATVASSWHVEPAAQLL
jgi:hypothetical protein